MLDESSFEWYSLIPWEQKSSSWRQLACSQHPPASSFAADITAQLKDNADVTYERKGGALAPRQPSVRSFKSLPAVPIRWRHFSFPLVISFHKTHHRDFPFLNPPQLCLPHQLGSIFLKKQEPNSNYVDQCWYQWLWPYWPVSLRFFVAVRFQPYISHWTNHTFVQYLITLSNAYQNILHVVIINVIMPLSIFVKLSCHRYCQSCNACRSKES